MRHKNGPKANQPRARREEKRREDALQHYTLFREYMVRMKAFFACVAAFSIAFERRTFPSFLLGFQTKGRELRKRKQLGVVRTNQPSKLLQPFSFFLSFFAFDKGQKAAGSARLGSAFFTTAKLRNDALFYTHNRRRRRGVVPSLGRSSTSFFLSLFEEDFPHR